MRSEKVYAENFEQAIRAAPEIGSIDFAYGIVAYKNATRIGPNLWHVDIWHQDDRADARRVSEIAARNRFTDRRPASSTIASANLRKSASTVVLLTNASADNHIWHQDDDDDVEACLDDDDVHPFFAATVVSACLLIVLAVIVALVNGAALLIKLLLG